MQILLQYTGYNSCQVKMEFANKIYLPIHKLMKYYKIVPCAYLHSDWVW